MRVLVLHRMYGCDSGCCGHVVEVDGEQVGEFHFEHPLDRDSVRAFAERLVCEEFGEEHVADLDWASSVVLDIMDC